MTSGSIGGPVFVCEERTLGVTPKELDPNASPLLTTEVGEAKAQAAQDYRCLAACGRRGATSLGTPKQTFTPRKKTSCQGRGILGLQREEGYVHNPN